MKLRSAAIETLRTELRRRFPLAVIEAWQPAAAPKRQVRDDRNRFEEAVGWPLSPGSLLMLSGHGSTCLAWALMRRVMTDEAMRIGYVDGPGAFFPLGAQACGIDLGHLLWVGRQGTKHCLRATELMVRSRAFGLVVLDIGDSRLPATAGRRLVVFLRHYAGRLLLIDSPGVVHQVRPTRTIVIEDRRPRWYRGVPQAGIDGWLLHIRVDGRGDLLVIDSRNLTERKGIS